MSNKLLVLLTILAAAVIGAYAWRVLPGYRDATHPTERSSPNPFPHIGDYAAGNAKAVTAETIIEFGDFECPYCGQADARIKALLAEHPRAKLVWKDCPLPNHLNAEKAAEAARCAGKQGKFWEYRDILFASASNLNPRLYASAASGLGLDAAAFSLCLDNGDELSAVRESFAQCADSGVTELPYFFLDGKRYSGADAISSLSAALSSR